MRIYAAPDNVVDRKDRAIWVTPAFDAQLAPPPPGEAAPYYNGPVMVSWALGGRPEVERRFWAAVHARGVASGKILSHYLDVRPSPSDEPQAENLPATINPLRFLLANLLRGNTLLVRIAANEIGPDRLDSGYSAYLRKILPPHVLLLLQVEMPPLVDPGPAGTSSHVADPGPAMPMAVDRGPIATPVDAGRAVAAPEFNA